VDYPVCRRRAVAQAVEILEGAALYMGSGCLECSSRGIGAGQAVDLMAGLQQFGDDGRKSFCLTGLTGRSGTSGKQRRHQRPYDKITPKDINTYDEGATQTAFDSGDAAFARNWPYLWSTFPKTAVQGKVGVAPLPHGLGGKSSATVGGWQIAVSKYSKHQGAALAWARYYASKQVEKWRAIYAGIAPTEPSVAALKSVKAANPALAVAAKTTDVTRPAGILGTNYATGSTYIYDDISEILAGATSVNSGLATLKAQLQSLHP
jgi:hypothetical protein